MKRTIENFTTATVILLVVTVISAKAQLVNPGTVGVNFVCTGGTIDVGSPTAGTTWVVRYSDQPTTTPNDNITLTGTTFEPTQTGYYYLFAVNTDDCESDPQEIPVYVLAPLTVAFEGDDYCSEDASSTEFTAAVTAADPNVTTYAYQWYTVAEGTETPIAGATGETFTPTETTPDNQTTYRVRAGYVIGGSKYCSDTDEKLITVLPKPTTPTITIGSTAEGW